MGSNQSGHPSANAIRDWLVRRIAEEIRIPTASIDVHQPFASLGLGSLHAVTLSGELGEWLGRDLPATLVWDHPTIASLSEHLERGGEPLTTAAFDESSFAGGLEPIAIVGMACRFPCAPTIAAFWELMRDEVDAIREVPPDRWDVDEYFDPTPGTPGKMNTRWGAFVDDLDLFDGNFFGISPREAARLDPQQRMLLEASWAALEDAGIPPSHLHGSRTAVMVGLMGNDYGRMQMNPDFCDMYMPTGNAISIASNRLSYFYNFRGPSITVDTACSSSLVAVHLACRSIWNGESNLALAGGANAILAPTITISQSLVGMLSTDGRCKTFDAAANGFVRGEGAGLVVLKPLADAQRDGDAIYAVIRGTAVNSDGRSNGLTAPNRDAQEVALLDACRRGGVVPGTIGYAEAHGTGTALGDPIEVSALGSVLSLGREPGGTCLLGSVKTNIGHLEGAAGVAGLIKAALCIHHGVVPPNLHFHEPNPAIPFDTIPLRVATGLTPWPDGGGIRVAAVNSFGFGGTNACAILSEATPVKAPVALSGDGDTDGHPAARPQLLMLSAPDAASLRASAELYTAFLRSTDGATARLEDICYTAARRRQRFAQRLAVAGHDHADMAVQLESYLSGGERSGVLVGRQVSDTNPRVAFVFAGQGTQWAGMGRELIDCEPVFRTAFAACDDWFQPLASWSLRETLDRPDLAESLNETETAQPLIFALQVSLAAQMRAWGVHPYAVIGHSMGEVAAAHVAGALTLEDAVRVVYHRSRLMQRTMGAGRMVSLGMPLSDARARVAPYAGRISIAALNGPGATVVAGETGAIEELMTTLEQERVAMQMLPVQFAFHSHLMDPLLEELRASLADIAPQRPTIPVYSTVTGTPNPDSLANPAYWAANLREPVLFQAAMEGLIDDGVQVYLELSPHPTLRGPVRQCLRGKKALAVSLHSLQREEGEQAALVRTLGQLLVSGCAFSWEAVYGDGGRFVRLPGYSWQRQRHWLDFEEGALWKQSWMGKSRRNGHPFSPARLDTAQPAWELRIDPSTTGYLRDHCVQGTPLLPATGFAEMALVAARELFASDTVVIHNLELKRPMLLNGVPQMCQVAFSNESEGAAEFNIFSRQEGNGTAHGASWLLHATGKARLAAGTDDDQRLEPDQIAAFFAQAEGTLGGDDFYAKLRLRGYEYGPAFQGVEAVHTRNGEALGSLRTDAATEADWQAYALHPAVMDAAVQVLAAALGAADTHGADTSLFLPASIEQLRVYGKKGLPAWSRVRVRPHPADAAEVEGDVTLYDRDGAAVAEIIGLHARRAQPPGEQQARERCDLADLLYELVWEYRPLAGGASHDSRWERLVHPSVLTGPIQEAVDAHTVMHNLRTLDAAAHSFDALARMYLSNAFLELGWPYDAGSEFTTQDACERLGIAAQHHRACHRLLEILAEDGYLAKNGERFRVSQDLTHEEPAGLYAELLARFPESQAELWLIRTGGERFAEFLTGQADIVEAVFPDGSPALVERLYEASPYTRRSNAIVRRVFTEMIDALPSHQVLRVLEIGAGTGGTTASVLPVLPPDKTRYVYTDVSPIFLNHAEQKFHAHRHMVDYRLLDIERPLDEQGFEPHSFDVILASNVLHATADLRASLDQVRHLLDGNGLLVLVEGTRPQRLLDCVFGLMPGWWKFQDFDIRPHHPLIDVAAWRQVLGGLGFDEVVASRTDGPTEASGQVVMVAQGPPISPRLDTGDKPAFRETPGTWLVFADEGGIGAALAERLEAAGGSVCTVLPGDAFEPVAPGRFRVRPGSADDHELLLRTVIADSPQPLAGIAHVWSCDGNALENGSAARVRDAVQRSCWSAQILVQAIVRTDPDCTARLYLVTRNAQPLAAGADADVCQAPLWGLGKVVAFEHPALRCTNLDVGGGQAGDCASSLFREIWSDDSEDRVLLRGPDRYVQRLVRTSRPLPHPPAGGQEDGETAYRLQVSTPGSLDNIIPVPMQRRAPSRGEIEIKVKAAGLNFRDILKALGMYPASAGEQGWIGEECSGIVERAGPGVEAFKPGDAVVAVAPAGFGDYAVAKVHSAALKPEYLSFEEAAAQPIAYATAYYALHHAARVQPGERVLIHTATGGVGLAAISVAKAAGAEIFATAGSPEKREYLAALGIRHIMNSRDLDFAREVMDITGGQGVDIVLNSLAGEALQKSLECLAPFGRFLEIGKRDIYQNHALMMLPFVRNISFTSIDLRRVMDEQPAIIAEILKALTDGVTSGTYALLPIRSFALDDAAAAFRHLARARHIGKVVLSWAGARPRPPVIGMRPPALREDATYLLTGAFGGFGIEVARWLATRGARHLALAGRRGPVTEQAIAMVEELRSAGVRVELMQADVSDEAAVAGLIHTIQETMPPLRGVMHAAMDLEDAAIATMTPQQFERVMAPKAVGAWNLHAATADIPLDHFVLFSSAVAVAGSPGQASYTAASTFVDALAHHRRAKGLPAVSINWGRIAEVGYVAERTEVAERLTRLGIEGIALDEALAVLGEILVANPVHVTVARTKWGQWHALYPGSNTIPVLGRFPSEGADSEVTSASFGADTVRNMEPEERHPALVIYVTECLARVLQIPAEDMDANVPLDTFGLDSISGMELKSKIERDLSLSLPVALFAQGASIAGFARELEKMVAGAVAPPMDAPEPVVAGASAAGAGWQEGEV